MALLSTGLGFASQNMQMVNDRQLMNLQGALNRRNATHTFNLQKQMWEYTNYGNQKKHMQEAGLNPALLYGMSGGGGTTTGSAQAQGVSQGNSQAVAMGLQAASLASQIKLMNTEAKKNEAEAEETESRIPVNQSIQELNNANAELAQQKNKLTEVQITQTNELIRKTQEETRKLMADADVAQETKLSRIEQEAQEYYNMVWEAIEKQKNIELKDAQINKINEETQTIWYNAISGRMTAEALQSQADTVAKRLSEEIKKWGVELDQKDEQILQQWIFGCMNGIANLGDMVSEFLPTKAVSKVIDKVTTTTPKGKRSTTRETNKSYSKNH